VALYALVVGACGADAADEKELQLVCHMDGQSSIKVLTNHHAFLRSNRVSNPNLVIQVGA
jgi:hypothetical protein